MMIMAIIPIATDDVSEVEEEWEELLLWYLKFLDAVESPMKS